MVLFGQLVIGPPGAGKTTYCHGMSLFAQSLGRQCDVVNLDFANDILPYKPTIDVRDLISQQRVMEEHELGPNGALIYCMEFLLENVYWLIDRLEKLNSHYVIFDCPGQVELFTHHKCMEEILGHFKEIDCRLCSVHLVDSFYCCQPTTFISAVLTVAASMLRLGLPHINVLSKIDLIGRYGPLPFNLDFYTEMTNLMPLMRYMDAEIPSEEQMGDMMDAVKEYELEEEKNQEPSFTDASIDAKYTKLSTIMEASNKKSRQHRKMTEALCDMLTDMGLVSFLALNIQDGETVGRVLAAVDKANGYNFAMAAIESINATKSPKPAFGQEKVPNADQLFRMVGSNTELSYFRSMQIMERYGKS